MMKQCFLLIVTVILVASILPAACCTNATDTTDTTDDSTDTGQYSRDDVLISFWNSAEERTLPDADRQEYCRWWGPGIILGDVWYLEYGEVYEIAFPGLSDHIEEWAIDMENSEIWPVNSGACLTAVYLFCQGRDDPSAACQNWFSLIDAMLEGMGE